MGKLHKALYKVLGIEHLKTTAYHPQTDGCLECWHACYLKAMLRKQPNRRTACRTAGTDWSCCLHTGQHHIIILGFHLSR